MSSSLLTSELLSNKQCDFKPYKTFCEPHFVSCVRHLILFHSAFLISRVVPQVVLDFNSGFICLFAVPE